MIRENREYRSIDLATNEEDYIVEGYATTWDDPYMMYEANGVKYYEQIKRNALQGADKSDILFLYNHEGKVLARQKNGTLDVTEDDIGIKVRADLSTTSASREMYEEIKNGLVDQMSWAFTVSEDEYDRKTHTRSIIGVKKVFDVSAVSVPANPSTTISARDYFGGVAEMEQLELTERKKKLLELKLKLEDQ